VFEELEASSVLRPTNGNTRMPRPDPEDDDPDDEPDIPSPRLDAPPGVMPPPRSAASLSAISETPLQRVPEPPRNPSWDFYTRPVDKPLDRVVSAPPQVVAATAMRMAPVRALPMVEPRPHAGQLRSEPKRVAEAWNWVKEVFFGPSAQGG
jgi:hypothetical protein